MDEDILAGCVLLGLFVMFPLMVGVSITSCVAYSRTKKWDKERARKAANVESDALLGPDDESDFVDSEDEAEESQRRAEEERDRFLTFGQMWRKEFCKVWNGKGAKQLAKEREREERRKLAKAVARELDRRERRRARGVGGAAGEGDALPPYKN